MLPGEPKSAQVLSTPGQRQLNAREHETQEPALPSPQGPLGQPRGLRLSAYMAEQMPGHWAIG